MQPLRQSSFMETKGILILGIIWFVGAIISSPNMIMTRVEPFKYGKELYFDCREDWEGIGGEIVSLKIDFFDLIIMLVLYFVFINSTQRLYYYSLLRFH